MNILKLRKNLLVLLSILLFFGSIFRIAISATVSSFKSSILENDDIKNLGVQIASNQEKFANSAWYISLSIIFLVFSTLLSWLYLLSKDPKNQKVKWPIITNISVFSIVLLISIIGIALLLKQNPGDIVINYDSNISPIVQESVKTIARQIWTDSYQGTYIALETLFMIFVIGCLAIAIFQLLLVPKQIIWEAEVLRKAQAQAEIKPKRVEDIILNTGGFTFTSRHEYETANEQVEKPLVSLRGVNVVFGRGQNAVSAMKNINLNIYRNEVLGLVGESGSGKTTTGRAICGIQGIKTGEIKIDDVTLPKDPTKIKGDIRKAIIDKVQMIFQDPANSLNPQKNIYSVASEGLHNIDVKSNFLSGFIPDMLINVKKISDEFAKEFDQFFDEKLIDELSRKREWKDAIRFTFDEPTKILKRSTKVYAPEIITYLNSKKAEATEMFNASRKMLSEVKRKMITTLLAAVGLDDKVLNRFPLEFSGGQQQRIGIVRAVAMRPQIIVADEPISALDVSIQAQVINILNDLKEQFNLTILFIAHDLRMVEYISDRIAIMYRGEIVEIGETDHIVNNPIHPYTKMLLKAVPSIDKIHENLAGEYYNPAKYKVEGENKEWFQLNNVNHFVFASPNELMNFFNHKEVVNE